MEARKPSLKTITVPAGELCGIPAAAGACTELTTVGRTHNKAAKCNSFGDQLTPSPDGKSFKKCNACRQYFISQEDRKGVKTTPVY